MEASHNISVTSSSRVSKGKGTYGMAYASQVEAIKQKIGGLESVRQRLGMSRRQICQLLLVNPSSWTRWTKSDAPPHFYRALEWLISIHNNGQKSGHLQTPDTKKSVEVTSPLFTDSTASIDWVEAKSSSVTDSTDNQEIFSLKTSGGQIKMACGLFISERFVFIICGIFRSLI